MQFKSFTLDAFQEEAIKAIDNNHSVVVSAPTGSGKTLIADYIINRDIKRGIKVIYTAPIKALSNQKYKEFSTEYGEENVGLLTGDIVKNPKASILIMTTEIYRNMALLEDNALADVSYVIFDEIHYINDIERGYVWEESIIFSKPTVRMLCLSATIPNAEEFADWIQAIKEHPVDVIRNDVRNVPLHISFYDQELGITTLEEIKGLADIPDYRHIKGRRKQRRPRSPPPDHRDLINKIRDKTPCLFFTFSRLKCQKMALELVRKNWFSAVPEISALVRKKLDESPHEIGQLDTVKILRQTLPYGVAFHHAGLIPLMKEIVEELFGKGLIKVLYTTETFAVGINMPAKSVCFESLRKFDGVNFRLLNSKEFFQISGRAGRRGIDKEGFAIAMVSRRDFEYSQMKKLSTADTDPIVSQFKLSVNTVLNLIKQHNKQEIFEILCKSFNSYQMFGKDYDTKKNYRSHSRFHRLRRKLEKLGFIEDGMLTEKGEFSSKVYADEIQLGEIFATQFYTKLNEYQMMAVLACLCYESRERTTFDNLVPSKDIRALGKWLLSTPSLANEKRFRQMNKLTALISPIYNGKSIFDILGNTNLLEGDVIRFFRQIIDRIGQVKQATKDKQLVAHLDSIQHIIHLSMQDIDVM